MSKSFISKLSEAREIPTKRKGNMLQFNRIHISLHLQLRLINYGCYRQNYCRITIESPSTHESLSYECNVWQCSM